MIEENYFRLFSGHGRLEPRHGFSSTQARKGLHEMGTFARQQATHFIRFKFRGIFLKDTMVFYPDHLDTFYNDDVIHVIKRTLLFS